MQDLGPATVHDMVLAFLQAEIDSARFGAAYQGILDRSRLERRRLLDQGDPSDPKQNHMRAQLLGAVRGFGTGQLLFTGFPDDVRWRRVRLDAGEVAALRYAKFSTWTTLSGGSRRVADGAANVDAVEAPEDANANIRAVAARVAAGERFPPLIAVTADDGSLVLMEGHTRATAYVLAPPADPVIALVGASPRMSAWAFH